MKHVITLDVSATLLLPSSGTEWSTDNSVNCRLLSISNQEGNKIVAETFYIIPCLMTGGSGNMHSSSTQTVLLKSFIGFDVFKFDE